MMKKPVSPMQKTLNFWAIILIVWSIYRANFHLPEAVDELIVKPAIFILPVYFFITRWEKRPFFAGIGLNFSSIKKDALVGFGAGGLFFLVGILANYFKHQRQIVLPSFHLAPALASLVLATATSVSEEVLSRGFVLKRLYQESKNVFSASFLASVLFFFLHVPILFTSLRISGGTILFIMATDIVFSLFVSFTYLERKSLLPAILIHALYNLSFVFFV
ncbi:CPBP family intramembrane metalloprotease [Patescibacteria group bacterium]|nr:CPBP family intramembrane metalloprotease [Patescibacteria group bacterium]MCL5091435.1 CPBP family intramembrane metalloprotease [Patescibacteria group bacterium]